MQIRAYYATGLCDRTYTIAQKPQNQNTLIDGSQAACSHPLGQKYMHTYMHTNKHTNTSLQRWKHAVADTAALSPPLSTCLLWGLQRVSVALATSGWLWGGDDVFGCTALTSPSRLLFLFLSDFPFSAPPLSLFFTFQMSISSNMSGCWLFWV